jgi:predicted flap endonuclease-1-like 5' DNA nuclease
MLFLQTLFFVALAFALGCFVGCWLKGQFAPAKSAHSGSAGAVTREGAAKTATAGELAAPTPHYEPATTPQPAAAVDVVSETPAAPDSPKKAPKAAKSAKPAAAAKTTKAKAKSSPGKSSASKADAVKEKSPAKPKVAAKAKSARQKPSVATTPDDLKQIKGVGPQLEAKLNAIGITSFAQIAKWTKKDQANFNEQLSFSGRIERDDWVAQAKVLAKGGSTEFSKRVAKGEVASSASRSSKRGSKKAD